MRDTWAIYILSTPSMGFFPYTTADGRSPVELSTPSMGFASYLRSIRTSLPLLSTPSMGFCVSDRRACIVKNTFNSLNGIHAPHPVGPGGGQAPFNSLNGIRKGQVPRCWRWLGLSTPSMGFPGGVAGPPPPPGGFQLPQWDSAFLFFSISLAGVPFNSLNGIPCCRGK